MEYIYQYETEIGNITLGETDGAITHLLFPNSSTPLGETITRETPLIKTAMDQVREYLAGNRKTFTVPIAFSGTPFQEMVWNALTTIPYGETRTYSEIAHQIGRRKAWRAVGMANNKNPISIIVPCHRVIGSGGKLMGYGGGVHIKEFLLKLEGAL
ncbi:methylated-DNA--[protein]-cysteine S-methyltransferase [Eubacteriales bacterium OttesenSCG-928-M02]|nr:methylated-DNA--[protein]-cysteine S-methyltransferase [Eubacteriales bacterium OttesenSCG-928-M02]